VWAGRSTAVLRPRPNLAGRVSNASHSGRAADVLSSWRAKMFLTSPRPWMLAKASGMAAVAEVRARRPASSCEGLIVLPVCPIHCTESSRRVRETAEGCGRSGVVEPVVRRERVGVSTNGVVDYASVSEATFPTKNERLAKKSERIADGRRLAVVRESQ